ncbi:hypothetical protein FVE85_8619 [Porphyridium purpureum]|uniref:Uncharacterized protein n=1 Tax=Porphyridium purpureum TaxID=35688 RepID=A0A5J4YR31_PORPP|nr:hypothetical protein FVE85_8619 [Porphyridium purpureum]|eukprot:POR7501..scf296_7
MRVRLGDNIARAESLHAAFCRHPLPIEDSLRLVLPEKATAAVAGAAEHLQLAREVFRDKGLGARAAVRDKWLHVAPLERPFSAREKILWEETYDDQRPDLFRSEAAGLQTMLLGLFEALASAETNHELVRYREGAPVRLSPYDLFRAHVFVGEHGVGVLLRVAAYPQHSRSSPYVSRKHQFPYFLGPVQQDSTLVPTMRMIHVRNVLWFDSKPCSLLAPIIHRRGQWYKLAIPGSLGSIYEGDFGLPLFEVIRFPRREDELLAYSYR